MTVPQNNSKKSHGGGVCAFIRNGVRHEHLCPVNSELFEVLWLRIVAGTNCILFAIVYFPPDNNSGDVLSEYISATVDNLSRNGGYSSVIICGDMNHLNTDTICDHCGLENLHSLATRRDSCLDKVLCSDNSIFSSVASFDTLVRSDHLGIAFTIPIPPRIKRTVLFRDHRQQNIDKLNRLLDGSDFSDVYASTESEDALAKFNENILRNYFATCPLKRVTVSAKDPFYVTPLIKYLLRKKNHLLRKGKRTDANIMDERIRKLIVENSRNHCRRGGSSWWRQVNNTLGRGKSAPDSYDNNTITAAALNSHYCAISTCRNYRPLEKVTTYATNVPEVTVLQTYNSIKRLKKTATGPDEIPHWIYSQNAHSLAEPLTFIFNLSLSTGRFPTLWKLSRISPIAKLAAPKEPKDYRPVAITCIAARVFERIIHKNWIVESYNLNLAKSQFGFRSRCSTSGALVKILNDIESYRPTHDYVRIIALDMSKAFDCISHESIREGLLSLNPPINPYVTNLLLNFLTERTQFVEFDGKKSEIESTNLGVPQGTVSGPCLYNLGTNKIEICANLGTLTSFADDNTPVVPGISGVDGGSAVVRCLTSQFAERNLSLNYSKLKELRINFRSTGVSIPEIDNIKAAQELDILGFRLDASLTFTEHINKAVRRANSAMYMLLRLKRMGYSIADLQILYNAYVNSLLTYGLVVWGGASKKLMNKIDSVQRRAVSMGFISEFTPISQLVDVADEQLYKTVRSHGETHPLYNYIPVRTDYANGMLRDRLPGVQKCTREKTLKIFPNRFLRRFENN